VPDYANLLFKVVAIFGVTNRVPATTPAHVFCYSAVAHILTPSVNLTFRPKSGFKNKCRTCAGFGLGPGSGFKMRLFYNSVWVCRQGTNNGRWKGYMLHPPKVKTDCNNFVKLATLNLGQMFLLLVRGYQCYIAVLVIQIRY